MASTASAGFIFTVTPALSPNALLSDFSTPNPSYSNWVTNADIALQATPLPSTSQGPAGPGQYNTVTAPIGFGQMTTTGDFNSWMGSVNAANGSFANETGNALRFGLIITTTNGSTFNLNELQFSLSDPGGNFTFGPINGYDFGTESGLLGFNGNTAVTDDNAPLTRLYYSGSGTSLEADCNFGVDCNPMAEQAYISNVLATLSGTSSTSDVITATYSLVIPDGNTTIGSGSSSVTVLMPEPSTWFLIGSAIPAVAALRRRRKKS